MTINAKTRVNNQVSNMTTQKQAKSTPGPERAGDAHVLSIHCDAELRWDGVAICPNCETETRGNPTNRVDDDEYFCDHCGYYFYWDEILEQFFIPAVTIEDDEDDS